MTDPQDPAERFGGAHSVATAETSDDRLVAIVEPDEGAPHTWWVADARYSDGWRPVTDKDEVGALVADINQAQAEAAEPVTSGPGDEPTLVKGDDGASMIGTGLAPDPLSEVVAASEALGLYDDPEGDAPGGEATPTAGTTPDDDEET